MDTNDLIDLLADRTRQLADALEQNRSRSPVVVATMEGLLRDVQELQEQLFGSSERD